jgi:hypothetical protein
VRVRGSADAVADLTGLLRVTGLQDVLADPLQPPRQPEPREQAGIEEVVHVRELPA